MRCEIVSVGNEVLQGSVVNGNAAFIAEELWGIGIQPKRHLVLPDDPQELREGLEESFNRSDLVLVTGGLGPTCDDATRAVAASIWQSDFRYDETIAADLNRRYGDVKQYGEAIFESIRDQATIPSKAITLPNPAGTASGFIFEDGSKIMILMPGVPIEMRLMMRQQVIPYLVKKQLQNSLLFRRNLQFFTLPEFKVDQYWRKLAPNYSQIEFGIYPGQATLRVQLSVRAKDVQEADRLLKPALEQIKHEFEAYYIGCTKSELAETVHHRLLASGKKMAVAESCTGGAFMSRLTHFSGASNYLLGGVVAYSNGVKEQQLGVSKTLLQNHGAVSEACVTAMLQGVFDRFPADIAVAVTGIAGPTGGTPEKPVGTVWCAVGLRGSKPLVWHYPSKGNRDTIIERSVNQLLGYLLKLLPPTPSESEG